jgi:hypothetical protein
MLNLVMRKVIVVLCGVNEADCDRLYRIEYKVDR